MSIILQNSTQLSQNPLNTSKSKQCFSFTHASRFSTNKTFCAAQFYDLPSTLDKKFSSMGYGHKYDFTKAASTNPPPNQYQVKTIFEDAISHKKGASFKLGRNQVKFGQTFTSNNTPAPNQYKVTFNDGSKKYSMRSKTPNPMAFTTQVKNPGPGTYPVLHSITKNGKYPISKYKGSGCSIFPPATLKRFQRSQSTNQLNPGPGTYFKELYVNKGNYILSNHKTTKARYFAVAARKDATTTNMLTPGPGSYVLPSDFGIYQGRPLGKR